MLWHGGEQRPLHLDIDDFPYLSIGHANCSAATLTNVLWIDQFPYFNVGHDAVNVCAEAKYNAEEHTPAHESYYGFVVQHGATLLNDNGLLLMSESR